MEKGFFSTVQMRILGALVLLMTVIALGSYATLNFEQADFVNLSPATISVSGEGEVLAVPDIGQFSFSVRAEGADAAIAQELSGTKSNDILSYLKDQGVEDKDIKLQNYNLYPKWKYEERICLSNSYCPPGERVQDGFEVNQSVSVKLRETSVAGKIIAGVGERGATNISGLNFTIDDTDALKVQAREEAIADAKEKAEALATQLGVRIIRLVDYNEGNNNYFARSFDTKAVASFDSEEGFGGPDIPVGEDSTIVNVNITYEVK